MQKLQEMIDVLINEVVETRLHKYLYNLEKLVLDCSNKIELKKRWLQIYLN
ncbi:hypothetical protein DSM107010_41970 [Chroococcidiopsis cubana SAG 39.79]|uniref:Uncharacterized protein n=1 Tax=Chroococcidiopsis cubana SAG 39.79 TaxID=388085 RepID=A0AB37UG02_9CYAN|nr:hypothetical protein DSM107010_41970 [Chroococcidiopsis cubana SAG 39.79]